MPQLKYHLKFNESQALFYLEDVMANDSDSSILEYALILSGSKEAYYTEIQNDIISNYKQSELGGDYFLIRKTPNEWQLSKETKEIAGYVCRKATTKYRRNSEVELIVTAWYAPDLPYQYGIKSFLGLPGLVLGLEEHGYFFYADKVNLIKKEQQIKTSKGKIIEQEDYLKKVDRYYGQFYELYGD